MAGEEVLEKLKAIQSMVSEAISACEGGEEDYSEDEASDSIGGGADAGDKIKMAATMLKKRMSA